MTENRPEVPDTIKPAMSIKKRILMSALRSPLSTIMILLFAYFGIQAFILHINTATNQIYMVILIFLWVFWYVARNIFKLILLAVVIAYGASLYHEYSTREISQCEASGGQWNEQTSQCEEKTGFWAGVFKRFQDLSDYADEKTDKTPNPTN